jgi:excisionase family DNA binding protein
MSRLSPMLTVADAAVLLSVSSKTVRRLIERGALSAHRIGRGLRITEANLRDYLRDAL